MQIACLQREALVRALDVAPGREGRQPKSRELAGDGERPGRDPKAPPALRQPCSREAVHRSVPECPRSRRSPHRPPLLLSSPLEGLEEKNWKK